MKKAYQKPTIQVVPVQMSQMLCMSGGDRGLRGVSSSDDFDFYNDGFGDDIDDR